MKLEIKTVKVFKGFGYERSQPSIVLFIKAKKSFLTTFDFDAFKKDLSFLDFTHSFVLDSMEAKLLFLISLISEIQKYHKIPIFECEKIHHIIEQNDLIEIQFSLAFVSAETLAIALDLIMRLCNETLPNRQSIIKKCERAFSKHSLKGINMFRILQAAHDLNMPYYHLMSNVYAVGYGINSRWFESTISDQTSLLGVRFARNKHESNALLRKMGFPMTVNDRVRSIEDAIHKAEKLGFPVVIKPSNLDGGEGVWSGIKDKETLISAYKQATPYSKKIIIEKHVDGLDFRLTIFRGQLIKTMLRRPGGVIGNGRSTILELIEEAQSNPQIARRSQEKNKKILTLDNEAKTLLQEFNVSEQTILENDRFIPLRRKANAYAGGLTHLIDRSHIHPENIRLAQRVASALRLDFAGIDLIISDISKPWHEVGGVICEVNAQPQIGDSHTPFIYQTILKEMVENNGQIPSILFIVDDQTTKGVPSLFDVIDRLHAKGLIGAKIVIENKVFDSQKRFIFKKNDFFNAMQSALYVNDTTSIIAQADIQTLCKDGIPAISCDLAFMLFEIDETSLHHKHFQEMIFPHIKKTVMLKNLEVETGNSFKTQTILDAIIESCKDVLSKEETR